MLKDITMVSLRHASNRPLGAGGEVRPTARLAGAGDTVKVPALKLSLRELVEGLCPIDVTQAFMLAW